MIVPKSVANARVKIKDGKEPVSIMDTPITFEERAQLEQMGGVKEYKAKNNLQLLPTYYKAKIKGERDSDSKRDIIMVVGPSQAGKTTYCLKYAEEYRKMYPNNNILLFTPNPPNKTAYSKNLNLIVYDLSNPSIVEYNLYSNPLTLPDLADSLIIFDDMEGLRAKDSKAIQTNLIDPILTNGRHFRISVLNCRHVAASGKITSVSHLETNYLVVFPLHEKKNRLEYVPKRYGGLDREEMQYVYSQPSRHCVIHNRAPHFLLGENYIKL